jgi:hydroxypyruvate isomerase
MLRPSCTAFTGNIAAAHGMPFIMEPLSSGQGQARMALDTAAVAFPVIEEVAHPNVKICFEFYSLAPAHSIVFSINLFWAAGVT